MEIRMEFELCLECPICGYKMEDECYTIDVAYRDVKLHYAHCPYCTGYWQVNRMTEAYQKVYYRDFYRLVSWPTPEIEEASHMSEKARAVSHIDFILGKTKTIHTALDFGCSSGLEMQALRAAVCNDVVGIEVGESGVVAEAQSQGLTVLPTLSSLGNRKFDLIVLSHVLEHMNHPIDFLMELKKYLSEGGYMLIDVPNVGADPSAMIVHHPIAFSYSSMVRLLDIVDLEIVDSKKYNWDVSPIERSMMFLVEDMQEHNVRQ